MSAYRFSALAPSLIDQTRDREVAAGRAVAPQDDGGPFPVRCCLRDVDAAADVLLLSVQPPTAPSPYAAASPVYVHRERCRGFAADGSVPEVLRERVLSLRAYTADHMIAGTTVAHGHDLEPALAGLFRDGTAEYVFAHFAGPGCYVCTIEPAA